MRRCHRPSTGPLAMRRLLTALILVYLIAWAAGFVLACRAFGLGGAMLLSMIPSLPLVVAARLRRRWPAVRGREFALLTVLLVVALGGVAGVVRSWYDAGTHRDHAEDVMYEEFGRRLRGDPAFRHVVIEFSPRKHIYWVSGTVATRADLDRLGALAVRCGITRDRLDGPFAHSASLTVEGSKGDR